MLRGGFDPEAQKKFRTRRQERRLLTRKWWCLALWILAVLVLGVNCLWLDYHHVMSVPPKQWAGAIIELGAFAIFLSVWQWACEDLRKFPGWAYVVIERANGAIHCTLDSPVVLRGELLDQKIGYHGPCGDQEVYENFLRIPLQEGGVGRICHLVDGGIREEPLVDVIVHSPIGDFTFRDGYNGSYRWQADSQNCLVIPLEWWLQVYQEFKIVRDMVFPRPDFQDEYRDRPWELQHSRLALLRLLLVMQHYVNNCRSAVPVKGIRILIEAAIEMVPMSPSHREQFVAAAPLQWRADALELGVKLPAASNGASTAA